MISLSVYTYLYFCLHLLSIYVILYLYSSCVNSYEETKLKNVYKLIKHCSICLVFNIWLYCLHLSLLSTLRNVMATCVLMVHPMIYLCVLLQCWHCIIKGLWFYLEGSTPMSLLDICYLNVILSLSVGLVNERGGLFMLSMSSLQSVSL